MEKSPKLYRVTLRGLQSSSVGMNFGKSYVVAENLSEAYSKVRTYLNKKEVGFDRERELDRIELLADAGEFNDVGFMLFL